MTHPKPKFNAAQRTLAAKLSKLRARVQKALDADVGVIYKRTSDDLEWLDRCSVQLADGSESLAAAYERFLGCFNLKQDYKSELKRSASELDRVVGELLSHYKRIQQTRLSAQCDHGRVLLLDCVEDKLHSMKLDWDYFIRIVHGRENIRKDVEMTFSAGFDSRRVERFNRWLDNSWAFDDLYDKPKKPGWGTFFLAALGLNVLCG